MGIYKLRSCLCLFNSRGKFCRIINGRRKLTLEQEKRLCAFLESSPRGLDEVFEIIQKNQNSFLINAQKPMIKDNRIDRLAIDEEEERLNRFFEILLRVDLRTIERLENEKENNNDNKIA